jgi:hypothetical protein
VLAEMAIREYVKDVRNLHFPGEEYTYSIKGEELAALRLSTYWKCDHPHPVDGIPASPRVQLCPDAPAAHVPTNGAEQGVSKE